MKIGQLTPKHKIHIIHSKSMADTAFKSECGLMFTSDEVRDCNNIRELSKSHLLCEHCENILLGK